MQLSSSKFLFPIISILTVTLIYAGCAKKNRTNVNIIKIGVACALAGDQADLATDLKNGAQLAVDEANEKGDLKGYRFQIYALDDKHNPTEAVTVANRFATDPNVAAVVGHLNSNATKAAEVIYNSKNLVEITPASTNPELSKRGLKTFFRICATDSVQGTANAVYAINQLHMNKFVVIDDKTSYGKGLADEFEKAAIKNGARIVDHESINQGESDYRPVLADIKGSNPDGIFYGGMYAEGGQLIKQAKELGIKAPFIGGDGMATPGLITRAGDAAEGTYVTFLSPDLEKVPAAVNFVKEFKKKFNLSPGTYAPYAYDATNIAMQAIERAVNNSNDTNIMRLRPEIVNQVRATRDFIGITGKINFDQYGDPIGQTVYVYRVEGGKFKYIGPAR